VSMSLFASLRPPLGGRTRLVIIIIIIIIDNISGCYLVIFGHVLFVCIFRYVHIFRNVPVVLGVIVLRLLFLQGQLKRGSGFFWRLYKGPTQKTVDGHLVPAMTPSF